MTKEITLSNGMVTLVDDEDYEHLSQFRWWASKASDGCIYARRSVWCSETKANSKSYMHREIMKPLGGQVIDHIDHNTLNNTRANLRACVRRDNSCNQRTQKRPKSSPFKGVSFYKRDSLWTAYLTSRGQRVYLGRFRSEIEAARAYDAAAVEHFGQFAKVNFP